MEIETKQYALRSFENSIWVILLYSHIICIVGPHRDLPSKGIMSRIDIGWALYVQCFWHGTVIIYWWTHAGTLWSRCLPLFIDRLPHVLGPAPRRTMEARAGGTGIQWLHSQQHAPSSAIQTLAQVKTTPTFLFDMKTAQHLTLRHSAQQNIKARLGH
jgi:hypothetical protein